ncbi:MAG TPA: hypothetical protein VEO02_14270 [Thermoanaerobaculia bacterium]|nr:hypothetical protein [Thermoanaerobaculia bacterium]
MRTLRLGAAFLAAVALSAGCGGKHEAASHETEAATPKQPPPTPDTTPVVVLRTPAGIALKAGEPTAAPTPAPK